jgi:hypothetical protein
MGVEPLSMGTIEVGLALRRSPGFYPWAGVLSGGDLQGKQWALTPASMQYRGAFLLAIEAKTQRCGSRLMRTLSGVIGMG